MCLHVHASMCVWLYRTLRERKHYTFQNPQSGKGLADTGELKHMLHMPVYNYLLHSTSYVETLSSGFICMQGVWWWFFCVLWEQVNVCLNGNNFWERTSSFCSCQSKQYLILSLSIYTATIFILQPPAPAEQRPALRLYEAILLWFNLHLEWLYAVSKHKHVVCYRKSFNPTQRRSTCIYIVIHAATCWLTWQSGGVKTL